MNLKATANHDLGAAATAQRTKVRALSAAVMVALAPTSAFAAAALGPASPASPATMEFQTDFLSTGTSKVDLSRFERGNVVLPGTYPVDVVVNKSWIGMEDVRFQNVDNQPSALPCFGREQLVRYGVDFAKVARGQGGDADPAQVQDRINALAADSFCGDLGTYIPGASVTFDSATNQLYINVPQLFMNNAARGYVDPAHWDNGITAGILGYNFSSSRTSGSYASTQSYLGLNAGVNLGGWRLRHQGNVQASSGSKAQYQNISTYLQHDLPKYHAQFTVGDTFTSGNVADSVRLRGVTLASDERMYPQSQQGYAPVVRGTAQSNARVSIRQNGYVIYETTVSPGPFAIDDLMPTGYGSDLEVTVTEADGRASTFVVPYAALPQLLRPGRTAFSVSLGRMEQYGTDASKPWLTQGTWQYGINNFLTGSANGTVSQGYAQFGAGVAMNTKVGAVSLNAAQSRTSLPNNKALQGHSLGVAFTKNISETGTNFALGAYRFSSSGFLNTQDAVTLRDMLRRGDGVSSLSRQRSRLDLNISQQVGNGQFFLNGSSTTYWNGSGRQTSYSAGYSTSIKSVSVSLTAQRTRVQETNYRQPLQSELADDIFFGSGRIIPGRTDNSVMLTVSMPLGSGSRAPNFHSYLTRNTGDRPSNALQMGVTGSLAKDNTVTYGVSASRNTTYNSNYANADVGYQAPYANLRAGYSRSGSTNSVSASVSGGVIVHGGGVTFSQQLGDTIGLVKAPGAKGASVGSTVGVKVDRRGYAVVPNLLPYQLNTVVLDPKGSATDVELKTGSQKVAPHWGSVSLLQFETDVSRAVVIEAPQANGEPLPFGAEVMDAGGKSVGVVGQAGKIFVRTQDESGSLTVKWGDAADQQCRVDYRLPPQPKGTRQSVADIVKTQCMAPGTSAGGAQPGAGNAPSQASNVPPAAAAPASAAAPSYDGARTRMPAQGSSWTGADVAH